jgi:hypothetical protein
MDKRGKYKLLQTFIEAERSIEKREIKRERENIYANMREINHARNIVYILRCRRVCYRRQNYKFLCKVSTSERRNGVRERETWQISRRLLVINNKMIKVP